MIDNSPNRNSWRWLMKVLIACEFSGRVREAFKSKGHDAFSCDILPAEDNSPNHLQCDVREILDDGWDMMIAHPPCTFMANSGVQHLHKDAKRWLDLFESTEFFLKLLDSPIPRIAVENPTMHKYAKRLICHRQQTQVIQPWMFGHMETKATCLWLKNLPHLEPTSDLKEETFNLPEKERSRLHYLPPSEDRWKIRSTTYQGIADAMADQWDECQLGMAK
jgi:hypothetical protein